MLGILAVMDRTWIFSFTNFNIREAISYCDRFKITTEFRAMEAYFRNTTFAPERFTEKIFGKYMAGYMESHMVFVFNLPDLWGIRYKLNIPNIIKQCLTASDEFTRTNCLLGASFRVVKLVKDRGSTQNIIDQCDLFPSTGSSLYYIRCKCSRLL